MPLPPGHMLGPYEILAPLGAGGMGEVYRARDTRLGREVAIKVTKERFSERFEREARTVAALNHPNIVAIYDIGPDFIVMELVDGHSLRGLAMGIRKMLDTALQVANGLAAAHAAGVVHRDLKPENILITKDGRAKIVDFGLAKVAPAVSSEAKTVTMHTEPGVVMGTVGYMSPEQVRGQTADHRSDIFSFGVILYEMLSGRRAFLHETAVEIMTAILREELPELPDTVPPGVRQVVRHCLEKAPEDRFQSARDLAFALGAMSMPSFQSASLTALPAAPSRKRRYAMMASATVLVVTVAVAAGWMLHKTPTPDLWSGSILGGFEMALDPRVSPGGDLVAFQAMDRGITQVAVMKPETANWSILTHARDKGYADDLAWSPDGASVYYTRYTDVPQGVYSVPVLGGDERLILENAGPAETLPDGSLIIVKLGSQRNPELYRFWPEAGRLQDLKIAVPPLRQLYARASPDGRRAVVYGAPSGHAPEWRLLDVDLSNGSSTPLLPQAQTPTAWTVSRDGASVLAAVQADSTWRVVSIPLSNRSSSPATLFTSTDHIWYLDSAPDGSVYLSLTNRPGELVRRPLRGGQSEKIGGFYAVDWQIEMIGVLPDGRAIVTLPGSGHWRLMAIEAGKDPVPLVTTTEETASPMTVAGPADVAFVIGAAPHTTIAVANTSTGRITHRISPGKGEIRSLSASPDGRMLYFAAGGAIWSQSAEGGEARMIRSGDSVVADPTGRSLVIAQVETAKLKFFRRSLDNDAEQEIKLDGSVPLMNFPLSPNALNRDGVLLLPLNDAWFNHPGLLDLATGKITRLSADEGSDYHSMAWLPDGRIVALQLGLRSTLWKFHATAH